ncbi:YhdP family protein [Paraglaciecola sp.]|uniref:YhdP family protein n=1 Tax=Paraglaciecola sp. TaxID=1920173 RepID=UPI00273F37BD|nr:YhdP family protein [Paraglaciecola sp.]MDP5029685.1 TIGR02099 family protein [Paraglaciecola sp.]
MRKPSFYVAYIVRKIWALFALSLVVVAVALSLLRFSLPYLDEQKHVLEDYLSKQFETELSIGTITAKWQGTGPAIVLKDVILVQDPESPVQLDIAETVIELDFWDSILQRQFQSNKFDLQGMRITLNLGSLRQENSDYPIVAALEKLFLQQLQSFSISDSSFVLITPNDSQTVLIDQVSWINKEGRHQGKGQMQVEEIARNSASFILDLHGKDEDLSGTFFAKGEELDLSPWINQWLLTPYQLTESRGSFVMWASIGQKALTSIQLDLSNSRFSWAVDDETIQAAVLGGQINAAPDGSDWVMNLDHFMLQINDQLTNTNWLSKLDEHGNVTIANAEPIDLSPYVALTPLLLDSATSDLIKKLQPKAQLDNLQLGLSLRDGLNLQADLSTISWQQLTAVPGLTGAKANITWSNNKGKIRLQSDDSTLAVDQLLPQNIDFSTLTATLFLDASNDGIVLSSEDIKLQSKEINLSPQFYFNSKNQFLSVSANVAKMDVADLQHYYPAELMGADTQAYLTDALRTGTVKGAQVLWFGQLDQFPFKQQQGIFQTSVDIEDGNLRFASEWPALSELDINLLFENEGLWMTGRKESAVHGKLLDVKLANLYAAIPSLSKGAVLTIDAKGLASGQHVRDLMAQSSLANSLGQALQQVQIDNQLEATLKLVIPLAEPNVVASGKVKLADSNVIITSLGMELEHAQGQVSFINDKVTFTDLNATLLGQAVQASFTGQQRDEQYQADIKLRGNWQAQALFDETFPAIATYLKGHSQWQADVALSLPEEGYEYSAVIKSDLVDLSSSFPAPFDKKASQSRSLILEAKGNKQATTVKLNLGDKVSFSGNLPHESMQFSRAHLAIGESDLVGMGLGFSISAKVEQLDADAWYQTISDLLSQTEQLGDSSPVLDAPKRVFVSADTALLAGQKVTNLEVVAKNTNDSWLLDINAKETRMEVALYKDWLGQGVNINADFIDVASWQSTSETDEPRVKPELDPNRFPPINFSCQRCSILNNDLGKIDFVLQRSANGMHIDSLRLNNSNGVLYAEGDWFINQGQSSTRLKGELSSSDFGALLKGFQFNSGIKDSNASAKFDLSWQQAPYEFNFATLSGNMDWRLSDGYLTEITDKGSRIFSILSLDSLVRKLKLDFRDVFAKGFFYDKMTGSFQIQNGLVDTRDTLVDGGAGEITMLGYTDLNSQELNYHISFVPKVTSSLPVIVAWMVNPATALAALALDQVLTSAKVISNIKFSLTGTFDEPVIEELGRDSKEITLPARTAPTSGESNPSIQGSNIDSQPVSLQIVPEELISG